MNYYNEFDPFAAQWLRELIKKGLIADGYVDERSIVDVRPDELREFTQCHFFAGIGGWSYALRLAGWQDDRPVWTGSCPCQPFSTAGNQKGKSDERHLWPVWFNLIRECRPPTVFGEQVASAVAHGWLDDVYQGLEAEGYACGAAVLPACSVGAPHKRDRLWFVADAENVNSDERSRGNNHQQGRAEKGEIGTGGSLRNVANAIGIRQQGQRQLGQSGSSAQGSVGEASELGDDCSRHWKDGQWINCPDGKQRLVEPCIPLLARGVRNRVGKLRGYGNAIVPQTAAKFIEAVM